MLARKREYPTFAFVDWILRESLLDGKESVMKERIETVLDQIRPALQRDGGDVELVEIGENGTVFIRLTGACQGCPMSRITVNEGIEKLLKSEIPEISRVETVH